MKAFSLTKDELVAYILLYAANVNVQEDNKERNVIISKVDMHTFQKVHDVFDEDNDYQSIERIKKGLEFYNYTKNDLNNLFDDIKTLFFADGTFDVIEQSVFMHLKRILR